MRSRGAAAPPALPRLALVLGLALACAALLAGAARGEAALSPALAQRLAAEPARPVPVVVTLRRQVDVARHASRPARLLRALRALARRTQPPVVARAGVPVRRLWITNALAMTVPPATARRLAGMPAVATVDHDRTVRSAQAPALSSPPGSADGGGPGAPPASGAVQSISQLPLDAIGARAVWSRYGLRGEGMLLGNIDTGVDAGNPDLAGKIAGFRDFVEGRPAPYDDNGHGTHAIGTMVGGDASGAPIGVAPQARVLVAKAMGADGQGLGSHLLAAAEWMADPDGDPATADAPAVVNNSWTGGDANDPWYRRVVRVWRAVGIVPVFAAGNAGPGASTIGSPASYPEVLAVAAVDDAGVLAGFSSRGPVLWQDADGTGPAAGSQLRKADVAAPGVAIVSSVGTGYEAFSGTSMAAPHVAGAVGLVRQAAPGLSPAQVAGLLMETATDMGPAGHDPGYGAGAVNVAAAVASLRGEAPPSAFAPQDALAAEPVEAPAAPAPAGPQEPADVERPPPRVVSPLRVVRARDKVLRQGERLVVTGLLTRPARVRAGLVRIAARAAGGPRRLGTSVVRPAGRFRLAVPLRRAAPGRYRLEVQAQTRAGRQPLGRPVRVRVRIARRADRRVPALRRLAALERAYRVVAPRPSCAAGRRAAGRAAGLRARARRGAGAADVASLRRRAALAREALELARRSGRACSRVAQTEGVPQAPQDPAAAAGPPAAPPPLATAPGVGASGPAVVAVTLESLVNGVDIDLSAALGEHQLPADLDLLSLDRLDDRACRGVAVICLGVDRPLLDARLRELVNRNQLTLALRNLGSGDLAGILTQLSALLAEGDLTELVSVQRVDDRVIRLAPMGPLDAISGLPDVPDDLIGRLQVVGVLRCPPAEVDGLPRACVA